MENRRVWKWVGGVYVSVLAERDCNLNEKTEKVIPEHYLTVEKEGTWVSGRRAS